MSIENSLDSLHARVKQNRLLQYFAAFNRVILAIAFIPSGMTKVLGNRFTSLPLDNPVGFFFEAFYQTGGWYRFVGFCQVLAALLLLIPRTSTLGATIFFPIVLNIAIITISVGFQGTWVITTGMFLANLYLICWDYDKFKAILPFSENERKPFDLRKSMPLIILGGIGGALAFSFFAMLNQSFRALGVLGIVIGFVAGSIVGLLNSWQLQKN
ncbi:MAG: DoxX family membrane protein [Pyrinomonadaceae bacterium]|nr:DoxX family membrane protein [Pyrinomonadaceae bacterium]